MTKKSWKDKTPDKQRWQIDNGQQERIEIATKTS
jgi:hypothetical protein